MLFEKFKKQPQFEIMHLVGVLFMSFGYILFLTLLHILATETTGNLASILNTTFTTFLFLFYFLVTMAFVYLIYKFLHWMVWMTTLPQWKKNEIKQNNLVKKQQMKAMRFGK